MAGMECPYCAEPLVITRGEPTADNRNRPAYVRSRLCVNPHCELFRIRLTTLEVLAPLQEKPEVVDRCNRIPGLPQRTAPIPDEPIPGVNA